LVEKNNNLYIFSFKMKKFIKTIIVFLLLGLILIMPLPIIYLVLDPFKVIKTYDTFYDPNAKGWVFINRDYISTTTFIKNYKNENYNSYILGNSRSRFFRISDWEKHLPLNSKCFHFDANGESIYGLHKKLAYIDKRGLEIKNAILVFDYGILSQDKPRTGHLTIISPELVNNSNIIDFHLTFFRDFLTPKFLYAFLDFKISGVVKPYMKEGDLLINWYPVFDPISNESFDCYEWEDSIRQNKYYTPGRLSKFYSRDTIVKYSPIAIKENQMLILYGIYEIFKKHKTNYKIIISPLYDQVKINQFDLQFLKNLFGENNVYDYSGINKYTKDYKNYYEPAHYRPHVAREILNEVYGGK